MESLELSSEEEKVKIRFKPAATSNSEPAQEPESDQSEKDEADATGKMTQNQMSPLQLLTR